MHDNNENVSINELGESKVVKKRKSHWQILALSAFMVAIISLFGIWYVNNERAFLQIENNRLKVEAENLREEIEILQTTIVQNDNQVKNNNSKTNDTQTESTQTESTQTESDYVNYEVKPGDTLAGISISLYGTEIYASQIAELNGFNADYLLQVGQKLKTPKKPGE